MPENDILYDSNGTTIGAITHTPGTAGILINDPGDYYISFSVTGNITNQFALFNGGVLVPGTIYGSDDAGQQNTGQTILTVDTVPATLTVRYHTNIVPLTVTLQTEAGGSQANDTASVFIQKLGAQTTVTVASSADLLAALNNNTFSRIVLTPGIAYNISTSPAVIRTSAVRLISTANTSVTFNIDQAFNFITIGANVTPIVNRITNITLGVTYATIQAAINAAANGNVIELSPGTYNVTVGINTPDDQLLINKSITLRGISSALTNVVFVSNGNSLDLPYMVIAADNVIVENINFTGPTPAIVGAGDMNSIFTIPASFGPPPSIFTNIKMRYNIFNGGQYTGFIAADRMQFIGNTIFHNFLHNCLVLTFNITSTLIYGNIFNGSTDSKGAILIENSFGGEFAQGLMNISNNSVFSFFQFIVWDTVAVNVSLEVTENYVNHTGNSYSPGITAATFSFYITGGWDFSGFTEILFQENIFVKSDLPNGLAVYLDYGGGGTNLPAAGQIKILDNFFSYLQPWGGPGDTLLPAVPPQPVLPIGYTTGPPVTVTMFVIQGNQLF
ncbi:hypothetical protein [Bacillus sp. MUM 13]|uniref:hypothetical protein n=1 Tax=Bacillus sp. MUM 13 TaxID=1678001 RepID=UPI001113DC0E|nr:hypothetical protein [Bacillus sp. MUM 13]